MIKQFYVENFKSFAEPISANIDDLLVIAGSNSGGKSSLIQALLLLSQTLDNPRVDVTLDLGGKYIQFAEFREMVYGRPKTIEASFGVGFNLNIEEPDYLSGKLLDIRGLKYNLSSRQRSKIERMVMNTNTISVRLYFGSDQSGKPHISSATYEKTFQGLGTVSVQIDKYGKKYKTNLEILPSGNFTIKKEEILNKLEQILIRPITEGKSVRSPFRIWDDAFAQWGFYIKDLPDLGRDIQKLFSDYKRRFVFQISEDDVEPFSDVSKDIIRYAFQNGLSTFLIQPIPFDHFLMPISPRYGVADISSQRFLDLFSNTFGNAVKEIRDYLRRIQYIGPLRAKPERAYLSTGTPIEIGNSGENAIPILWLNQKEKVKCKTKIGGENNERKLVDAVQDWLQEFGIAFSFHITKPKRVIYQAELESSPGSKTMVTIADVGFGVSQLLPVIIAGLTARQGSTLILEQPEIHLHPKLQGKLADFLICMIELDKRVIVETHSEHLINMLRLRILQDTSGDIIKKIGIIFVRSWQLSPEGKIVSEDKTTKGSYIENLKVDEYGRIINWPPDFFPDSSRLNEEILKAMLNKFPSGWVHVSSGATGCKIRLSPSGGSHEKEH